MTAANAPHAALPSACMPRSGRKLIARLSSRQRSVAIWLMRLPFLPDISTPAQFAMTSLTQAEEQEIRYAAPVDMMAESAAATTRPTTQGLQKVWMNIMTRLSVLVTAAIAPCSTMAREATPT